ncbi:TRAP transporter small permease [Egibacter rhizosphaerae]|uniref:TRAP transporter small permease n=1 Tax=Egibacter rhizosphaerae TaxID=1670831 RepID=A0A411YFK9_9ACTN|nr:TRAP transporter small permease [Egibacter rhizosphaerae]QBI19902.1 TRAP transporter small permease [Egibacter rhizosphaerae]
MNAEPSGRSTRSSGRPDLLDGAVWTGQALAGVLLLLVMLSVVAGIVGRAVFASPLPWVLELSGTALLFMTFLATAYVARQDAHVRLELLDMVLSPRAIRGLDVLALTIQILVTAALFYASAALVLNDLDQGTTTGGYLRLDRWPITAIIPLGTGLLLLQLLRTLVQRVRTGRVTRG